MNNKTVIEFGFRIITVHPPRSPQFFIGYSASFIKFGTKNRSFIARTLEYLCTQARVWTSHVRLEIALREKNLIVNYNIRFFIIRSFENVLRALAHLFSREDISRNEKKTVNQTMLYESNLLFQEPIKVIGSSLFPKIWKAN